MEAAVFLDPGPWGRIAPQSALLSPRQAVFFVWVGLNEHTWAILAVRQGLEAQDGNSGLQLYASGGI
jgi:hypothetical protein